jgi:hypothetical protein
MPLSLKQAWTQVVDAAQYERHMAAIGQAQANASLVEEYLRTAPPPAGSRILVAGAGPGQMFDFAPPAMLAPFHTVFTDINPGYLKLLEARLKGSGVSFETAVDDLEASSLSEPFSLAIVVLVLEHVEWPAAVGHLARLAPRVFAVIQENPPGAASAVTESRAVPPTIEIFHQARPHLLNQDELAQRFRDLGFEESHRAARKVADGKRMLAIEFSRRPLL